MNKIVPLLLIAFVVCNYTYGQQDTARSSKMHDVYGRHCGYAGTRPYYRQIMIDAVNANDTTTLNTLIFSYRKELNAYGAEGYVWLQKRKYILPVPVAKRVKETRKDKSLIYACSGCTHWNRRVKDAVKFSLKFKELN